MPFRRTSLAAFALLLLLSAFTGFAQSLPSQLGDLNLDNRLDVRDLVLLINHINGARRLANPLVRFGDADQNGVLATNDLSAFAHAILHDVTLPIPSLNLTVTSPPLPSTRQTNAVIVGRVYPGMPVRIDGGLFSITNFSGANGLFSISVPLVPNRLNRLYVSATDEAGNPTPPRIVEVFQDSQPPNLYVDFPTNNQSLTVSESVIAGRVGDMLSGFMGLNTTVAVTNVAAGLFVPPRVANVDVGIGNNGTFEQNIPLELGTNRVTVTASDVNGNTVTRQINILRVPLEGARMFVVSGDRQATNVHRRLAQPIVVRVTQADGVTPFPNKPVTFEVTRSDGRLLPIGGTNSISPTNDLTSTVHGTMKLQLLTDASGEARAWWAMGGDAGCGNNRVCVTSRDIGGSTFFCASAHPARASQINIGSGNNQKAEVNSQSPEPLRAWVNDSCNGVPGIPVTFTVVQGSGKLLSNAPGAGDQGESGLDSITVPASITGHAPILFRLGSNAGPNVIEANFPGNPGLPATFTVTGLARDPARPTTFTGLILDNTSQPIGGAWCRLFYFGPEGKTPLFSTYSDAQGRFTFTNALPGPADLNILGSYATTLGGSDVPFGSFPALSFTTIIVPNAENSLPRPVLLPRLNLANARSYQGTNDLVLTCEGLAGLKMTIKANSMRLPNGSPVTPQTPVTVSLNQVHHDDVPMPMPDGAAPPFAWTLQPGGATFDPPIQIEYPNMSGLPAGSIAYFLTFNHDTERFEIVASGHVQDDSATIVTDPGAGLTVAGWGCNCPPYAVTGKIRNKCKLAVVCFQGGPSYVNWLVGRELDALCSEFLEIDPNRIAVKYIGSRTDVEDHLSEAESWLKNFTDQDGERAKVLLVGHSLGGDTIRLSGKIEADARVAIDPISRELALNSPYFYYQRGFSFSAPGNLVANFLASDLTDDEKLACQPPVRLTQTQCLRGYKLGGAGTVLESTDHSSVVTKAAPAIKLIIRNLLQIPVNPAAMAAADRSPIPDPVIERGLIDSSFVIQVGGQSFGAIGDGTVQLPNIAAQDQHGLGGPGTPPDFVSDDYLRLIGISSNGGTNRYAFSEFFQIRQNQTTYITNITITTTPPRSPESLRAFPDRPTLTATGQTTQVRVTAMFADGTTDDVSPRSKWSTYRTSNPNIAHVSPDGLVTARGAGRAFITAVNEGSTTVAAVDIVPGDPLTTVRGFVQITNGVPVSGALVRVIGSAGSATTGPDGGFVIENVATAFGVPGVTVLSTNGGWYFGQARDLAVVPGGVTDAGLVSLLLVCTVCPDQDGDRLPDAFETLLGTNPTRPDGDGDQLSDYDELFVYGTEPTTPDADHDGLSDRDELITYQTNPRNADTDGDGWDDGVELVEGPAYPRSASLQPRQTFTFRPPLTAILPGSEELGLSGVATTVVKPPVRVSLPAVDEIGQSGVGVVLALPPVRIILRDQMEHGALGINALLAFPPIRITNINVPPAALLAIPNNNLLPANKSTP